MITEARALTCTYSTFGFAVPRIHILSSLTWMCAGCYPKMLILKLSFSKPVLSNFPNPVLRSDPALCLVTQLKTQELSRAFFHIPSCWDPGYSTALPEALMYREETAFSIKSGKCLAESILAWGLGLEELWLLIVTILLSTGGYDPKATVCSIVRFLRLLCSYCASHWLPARRVSSDLVRFLPWK